MISSVRATHLDDQIKDTQPSFHNTRKLHQKIDSLPTGPDWIHEVLSVDTGMKNADGTSKVEEVQLWRRDPNECVEELIGDPTFNGHVSYRSEKVFTDFEKTKRCFGEMNSGDWWEEVQVRSVVRGRSADPFKSLIDRHVVTQDKLPEGATVAPIIISSDETQLSKFRGDKTAWPVYLSIGNISKDIRRKTSMRATVLLGYIPSEGLDIIEDSADRSKANWQLFHDCVRRMLLPLKKSGKEGRNMLCGDGYTRLVFPIIAAYVADYPEQCLIACCKNNRCPKCVVGKDDLGENTEFPLRNATRTQKILERKGEGKITKAFETEGLRPIFSPFWRDFPHCDIFSCFTPDLLHQLHIGVFHDHLLSWIRQIAGDDNIDERFKTIPSYPGLRHFKQGISPLTQCTGTEHKEMQRCILAILTGAVQTRVVRATRAILEFIYYAQFQTHTHDSLDAMQASLDEFHAHKDIFVELDVREHFNIPKVHSMQHYVDMIRSRGTADGYNTELPERLHIDFAKEAYRASNRRDFFKQMTKWLTRQEGMFLFCKFINWKKGQVAEAIAKANEEVEETADNEQIDSPDPAIPSLPFLSGPDDAPSSYALAKTPSFPHMSIADIEAKHSAPQFQASLDQYLRLHIPTFRRHITAHDMLPVYKQMRILLKDIPQVSSTKRLNTLRAIPQKKSTPGCIGTPERFDPVLVRCRVPNDSGAGTSLEGKITILPIPHSNCRS